MTAAILCLALTCASIPADKLEGLINIGVLSEVMAEGTVDVNVLSRITKADGVESNGVAKVDSFKTDTLQGQMARFVNGACVIGSDYVRYKKAVTVGAEKSYDLLIYGASGASDKDGKAPSGDPGRSASAVTAWNSGTQKSVMENKPTFLVQAVGDDYAYLSKYLLKVVKPDTEEAVEWSGYIGISDIDENEVIGVPNTRFFSSKVRLKGDSDGIGSQLTTALKSCSSVQDKFSKKMP